LDGKSGAIFVACNMGSQPSTAVVLRSSGIDRARGGAGQVSEWTGHAARAGDGVSSILITSNDLAGAWALRPDGQPMLPLVPGEPRQRELAFRAGVNIVMYALTGNYKADQVHIPALLERLGQ